MSFLAPTLTRVRCKTTAKCWHCDKVMQLGDLILSYVSSSFRGATHWRMVHFGCLLEKSEMTVQDVMNLATMEV